MSRTQAWADSRRDSPSHSKVSPRKMKRRPEWLRLEMAFPLWVIITTDSLRQSSSARIPARLLPLSHIQSARLSRAGRKRKKPVRPAIQPKDTICSYFSVTNTKMNPTLYVKTEIDRGEISPVWREILNAAEQKARCQHFSELPVRNVLTPTIKGEHNVQANRTCWDS